VKLPTTGTKEKYMSFDYFKESDFDLKELYNLEADINRKD
jgi:hypothetical protein